jgi:hypothetical protein
VFDHYDRLAAAPARTSPVVATLAGDLARGAPGRPSPRGKTLAHAGSLSLRHRAPSRYAALELAAGRLGFRTLGSTANVEAAAGAFDRLDPRWRVVAGFLPATDLPINLRVLQATGNGRAEQQMINPQTGVPAIGVWEVRLMPLLPARSASCRWRAEDGLQWPVRHQMWAVPEPEG